MVPTRQRHSARRLDYSEDGYIRLTFQQLCALAFARRTTIEDHELCEDLRNRDIPAVGAGYCDWLDIKAPAQVSVGWAWFVIAHDAPRLLAPGGFSSNVMIVTASGRDIGAPLTNELLAAWLSMQRWQRGHTGASPDNWRPGPTSVH
jgi:hypothetical protein